MAIKAIRGEPWVGQPRSATADEWRKAAASLGVDLPVIEAVASVESGMRSASEFGGAIRRFEPHVFRRERGRWREWLGMPSREREEAFRRAWEEDRVRACEATSWGLFQIMGFHAEAMGYRSAVEMAEAMSAGESYQLGAFVAFVREHGLDAALQAGDWEAFSLGFNGPGQPDVYAERLRGAIRRAGGRAGREVVSIGSRGPAVREVQRGLGLDVDGVFGPVTDDAVRRVQKRAGIAVDGIVGRETWAELERDGSVKDDPPFSKQGERHKQVAEGVATISGGAAALQQVTALAPPWALHGVWIVLFAALGVLVWVWIREGSF